MNEKMNKYLAMVKELKALGEAMLDNYDEYPTDFIEEVECMDEHLHICARTLEKAKGGK